MRSALASLASDRCTSSTGERAGGAAPPVAGAALLGLDDVKAPPAAAARLRATIIQPFGK